MRKKNDRPRQHHRGLLNPLAHQLNKYRNERTVIDGISFASKKEAKRYKELMYARLSGDCLWFLRQTPFHLAGGVKYISDFIVFWRDGSITIEDVKGIKTPVYLLKKKQVEATYPITITEI